MKVLVVGSGPAGVSAATALLEKGHRVVMLDYGNDISPERQTLIEKIADTEKEHWNDELIRPIRHTVHTKMETKLAYGENFPYQDGLNLLNIRLNNCGFYPSLAVGGLSNVWGGAVLPYIDSDIQDWPISIDELSPYYEKINSLMTVSTHIDTAYPDELVEEYPFYQQNSVTSTRKLSPQTREFYLGLKKNSPLLSANGFKVGFSRNAFQAESCTECGLCMWGCPNQLIYNSKQTLQTLTLKPNFKYVNRLLVRSFFETTDGKVTVSAVDKSSGEAKELSGDKLVLASGVLGTAKIVLHSLKKYRPVEVKQSAHFLFPLIDFKISGKYVGQRNSNTLSQLFVEVNNKSISDHTVHLQVYPFNDMMTEALKHKLGQLYLPLYPIIKYVLNKTIIVQGFLHSAESEKMKLQLNEEGTLTVTGDKGKTKEKVKKLIRSFRKIGFVPTYEVSVPGRSYHCGGTFPMIENDETRELTTNKIGLLNGTRNVHIVDSSVFPSIPAQTITYTVMANAYRIGSLI